MKRIKKIISFFLLQMFVINFLSCSNSFCFASENEKKLEGHAQFYELMTIR